MGDKKRSVMKKWKRTLIAAALTASMILALPVWNVGSAEAASTGTLDLENNELSLTVKRAGTGQEGYLQVDLYKVASATKSGGYDAYTLTLLDDYKTVSSAFNGAMYPGGTFDPQNPANLNDAGLNEAYRNLAQDVARIALGVVEEETTDGAKKLSVKNAQKTFTSKTISGSGSEKFEELEPGMYLVVAHGKNLSAAQYTGFIDADVTVEDAPAYGAAGQKIVTRAYSNGYTYTYLPELISLPMRGTGNAETVRTGGFNTSSTDPWQYSVTVELKSEQSQEMASLRIEKTFSADGQTVLTGATKSVFEIEAKVNGVTVYSNTVAIASDANEKFKVLEKVVPVGASVTVKEVYDGAGYALAGTNTRERTFIAEGDAMNGDQLVIHADNVVAFTNNYNGVDIGGDVLINSFTHSNGGWLLNGQSQTPAPAQPETPGQPETPEQSATPEQE